MSVDDDFKFQIEARLTSHGVYVDEVEYVDDTYRLTYESISTASEGIVPHREVGRVINVFRDLHDEEWNGANIEAVVTDLEGRELGEWHVEQEWLASLNDDTLSEVEFSEKVIETIEPADEQ
ncbi:MAG: hypothetical protein V5A55_03235 [Halovenus sp.]